MSGSGWNRGTGATKPAPQKKPGVMRGILVGSAVLAVGLGIGVWMMAGGKAKNAPASAEKKTALIKEAKPHLSPKVDEPKEEPESPPKLERPAWVITTHKNGVVNVHTQSWDYIKTNASWVNKAPGLPKKLYTTRAENYVAALMRIPQGGMCMDIDLGPNFDKEFIDRIADPVGYQDDDSEEDKEVRRAMVEFKRDAAQKIADGMTPTEIVKEARRDLNRLSQMRSNLAREIGEMRRQGASEADIEVATEAANKLLEKNGGHAIKYKPSRAWAGRMKVLQQQEKGQNR